MVAQKLTASRTLSLKSKAKSRSKRAHLKLTEYDRQDKMVETNRARSLLALGSIGELGNGLKMPACVSRNDHVGELTS